MNAATFTTDTTQQTRGWDAGRSCGAGRLRSLRTVLRERIELKVSGWAVNPNSGDLRGREPARHLQGFSFREGANSLWSVELGASNHA